MATFIRVVPFNNEYHIVERLDAGTLRADIYDHQVDHANGKQVPSENADRKTDINEREMRQFKGQYLCATKQDLTKCTKAPDKQLQSAR